MADLVDLQGVLRAHRAQVRTRRLGSTYCPLINLRNTTNPQKSQNHIILLHVVLVPVNHDAGPPKTN